MSDEPQHKKLANLMAHLLDVVDASLAQQEVPLPSRPYQATLELLRYELVSVEAGEPIDVSKPAQYMAAPWFRALFTGVEEWYRDHYGAGALAPKGNPPLVGVVLIRGAPFLFRIPAHRAVVEVPGKTSWMYFEAGLGDGEDPRAWLVDGPNFERLDNAQTLAADSDLSHVAAALRAVHHHLLGAGQSETERGLRASIRSYLESAAWRILAQTAEEFAFAWMDLQMAAEAALKLVIFRATGTHPYTHPLTDLLADPGASAVTFDPARLSGWPKFSTISNRRYGGDYMAGLPELYDAYKLALDLIVACVRTIKPPINSGAGFLLHIAPWLVDDPLITLPAPPAENPPGEPREPTEAEG